MNDYEKKISRRKIIKLMTGGIAASLIATRSNYAQANKVSKEAMQYRDKPNGKQSCSNCLQFIPGKASEANGECKVVEGSISPQGWCNAYAAKA
jgi:hypothetical protein